MDLVEASKVSAWLWQVQSTLNLRNYEQNTTKAMRYHSLMVCYAQGMSAKAAFEDTYG